MVKGDSVKIVSNSTFKGEVGTYGARHGKVVEVQFPNEPNPLSFNVNELVAFTPPTTKKKVTKTSTKRVVK